MGDDSHSIGGEGKYGNIIHSQASYRNNMTNFVLDDYLTRRCPETHGQHTGLPRYKQGDYIGLVVDSDTGTLRFAKNGTLHPTVVGNVTDRIYFAVGRWHATAE